MTQPDTKLLGEVTAFIEECARKTRQPEARIGACTALATPLLAPNTEEIAL